MQFEVSILERRMAELSKHMPKKVVQDTSRLVIAPMPGVVKSVSVKVGDDVSDGWLVLYKLFRK